MSSVGGIPRSFGLSRHFSNPDGGKPPRRIGRKDFLRIIAYFKPYRMQCLLALLSIGITSGLQVVPPFCVKLILDKAVPQGDLVILGWVSGAMVASAVIAGLVGVYQQSLTATVGQGIMFDLRKQLFAHLQRMPMQFYTETRSGEIVSRVNNDVNAIQESATNALVTVVRNLATLTAVSLALIAINWKLALVAVAIVPVFYLPSKIVGAIGRRLTGQIQEAQASLLAFMNERLQVSGAALSKTFGQAQSDSREFNKGSAELRVLSIKRVIAGRWLFMILSVFSTLGPALVYWYGGYQIIRQELTVGMLVAFVALLMLLYRPLVTLGAVYMNIQAAVAVFERIFEYLDLEPEKERAALAPHKGPVKGRIVFDQVSFCYPLFGRPARTDPGEGLVCAGKEPFSLDRISFEVKAGTRVALVGPSGAGKSTITNLLPRFYDPDQGSIRLDGRDLRDYRLNDLRRQIGLVSQETHLFNASIRDNLAYAKSDLSDEEMKAACQAAHIDEFINRLPAGYDTVVGERGFRLSGGEKQRISIARALLKGAPILILDEPTSNLDATSEYFIQRALELLLQDRTSLIIAHRLSTILGADQIVVLDSGRIADTGSHAELLARGGLYAELFEQQFGAVLKDENHRGKA